MSIWKPKGSPFYHFDFQWRGRRFHGSTKRTNRREAEQVERDEREKAKQLAARAQAGAAFLTLDAAAGRYWSEVGQHHVGSDTTWRDLERLISYFGPAKSLHEIHDDDVAKLIAWRRGHRVARHRKGKAKADDPFISNATVNRSTLEPLKKLFGRAKRNWGERFDREPNWKAHRLPEPQERVRELRDEEDNRLDQAMRADYEPFFAFARVAGLRLRECLLKWPEVDWSARQITKRGKGGKIVSCPITPTIRAILWPLREHDPVHVFTYVAQRTRGAGVKGGNKVKGARYPLTYNGVKSQWKRIRKAAGLIDFRFHDFRHDVGTKLLRETGNLKLVQRALNHSNIATTTKYAHVLTDEVAAALDRVARSRNKSRSGRRKAG